ncbi:Phosphodiest-domain-containing protein [Violaceomyces palustris]|uniref:Phosphodiest-domain-containing protein n=1 Tax=Violaceomyces palustris TaxID=1673888 RepID=A0ACD0P261_9BASI|nr:Phosphodiest-domain-containing protein [Violaceomyces palustris]
MDGASREELGELSKKGLASSPSLTPSPSPRPRGEDSSPKGRRSSPDGRRATTSARPHPNLALVSSTLALLFLLCVASLLAKGEVVGTLLAPLSSLVTWAVQLPWPLSRLGYLHATTTTSPVDQSAGPPIDGYSNRTRAWPTTVLLISLDGFKPSYLDQGLAPSLQRLGLGRQQRPHLPLHAPVIGARRAEAMRPIYPTLTFPNHWSILTGLYAESHGIVANDFHSNDGQPFLYTDPTSSWGPRWWRGTPIWESAVLSGIKSAVLMWPGPPTTQRGTSPTYFQRYQSGPEWDLVGRRRKLLEWLDMEVQKRPRLICAYVPDVDQAAHKWGPSSPQAQHAVKQVDTFISDLLDDLERRRAQDLIDIVIVSDHGMTETSNDQLVFLDRILGDETFAKLGYRDGWPSAGLRPSSEDLEEAQIWLDLAEHALRNASEDGKSGFDVYRSDEGQLPERWHISGETDRVAPLWAVPRLGWSITDDKEFQAMNETYEPLGNHGYDNRESEMSAIFLARGPSFKPLAPAKASQPDANMPIFQNTEIYNLISAILDLPQEMRAANNGTANFWDSHLHMTS